MVGQFVIETCIFLKTYLRNSNVSAAALDQETVLMSTEGNRYFSLNALGTDIWRLLEQPRTTREIVAAIRSNYDVDEEQASQDVNEFLEALESRKLISTQ